MENSTNRLDSARNTVGGHSWPRLIALTLLVLLLAGAAGWYFFFRNRAAEPAEAPPLPETLDAPAPAETPAPPAAQPEETAAETPAKIEPVDVTNGDAPGETLETPGRVELPSSRLLTDIPVDEPIKGVPHRTDPADDGPYVAPDTDASDFAARLDALKTRLTKKEYAAAVPEAEKLLAAQNYGSDRWRQVAGLLTEANTRLYLSGARVAENGLTTHVIRPGETMFKIAQQYGIPLETLLALNRLKAPKEVIYPGDKLTVPSPKLPWRILVTKRYHLLELFRGERRFAAYEIGIGRRDRTPVGRFVIYEKIENPDYITHDRRIIPAGQPGNQLGSRWMRLSGATADDPQGYGIHGTPNEASVGKSLSNGCLRMRNRDLENLFLITPTGTPVIIRE